MTVGSPRGTVTRFVQVGTFSIALCAVTCAVLVAMALTTHIPVLAFGVVAILLCGILLSTLTIEVDDRSVFWCFTGGLFSRRVEFENLATFAPGRWERISLGYRIGFNRRAWIVGSRDVVTFRVNDSPMEYVVGCNDPAAVCAEIERRAHR